MIKTFSCTEQKHLVKEVRHWFEYAEGKLFWKHRKGPKTQVGQEVGSVRPDGYRHTVLNQRQYFTHHLVWVFFKGEYPRKNIDHINGDISDNRIENLRLADQWQNRGNSSGRKGKSLPTGVHKTRSGKYMAIFRNAHIVTSESVDVAKQAYQKARKDYYGEFARSEYHMGTL